MLMGALACYVLLASIFVVFIMVRLIKTALWSLLALLWGLVLLFLFLVILGALMV